MLCCARECSRVPQDNDGDVRCELLMLLSVCLSLRLCVPGSIHPSSERRICRSCPSDLPAWLPGSTDADVKRERRRRRRHRYKLLN